MNRLIRTLYYYILVFLALIIVLNAQPVLAVGIEHMSEKQRVATLIERYTWKYTEDATLALNVAYAESQFRNVPNYKYDGENGKYTAYGPFQLTRTFYKSFCGNPMERLIVEKNIECAVKVMYTRKNALNHWKESKYMNGSGWLYLPYTNGSPDEG